MKYIQTRLFDEKPIRKKVRTGGSSNPIVFHDYDSYIAKFSKAPKTTDETYTPRDVYEAVVSYVRSIYPMEGKEILRPFYPGGDYARSIYPDNGVVIDNPPFSIFTRICEFYARQEIPFFLFGPGLTILSCLRHCSAVIISNPITFANGAKLRCNFATNLLGDVLVTTAPTLSRAIALCPSQDQKANLKCYHYPDELLSVSDMQTIASRGVEFSVKRDEAIIVRSLDNLAPGCHLFGNHLLTNEAVAKAKVKAKAKAKAVTTTSEKIHIELSIRERRIIKEMSGNEKAEV